MKLTSVNKGQVRITLKYTNISQYITQYITYYITYDLYMMLCREVDNLNSEY